VANLIVEHNYHNNLSGPVSKLLCGVLFNLSIQREPPSVISTPSFRSTTKIDLCLWSEMLKAEKLQLVANTSKQNPHPSSGSTSWHG